MGLAGSEARRLLVIAADCWAKPGKDDRKRAVFRTIDRKRNDFVFTFFISQNICEFEALWPARRQSKGIQRIARSRDQILLAIEHVRFGSIA